MAATLEAASSCNCRDASASLTHPARRPTLCLKKYTMFLPSRNYTYRFYLHDLGIEDYLLPFHVLASIPYQLLAVLPFVLSSRLALLATLATHPTIPQFL